MRTSRHFNLLLLTILLITGCATNPSTPMPAPVQATPAPAATTVPLQLDLSEELHIRQIQEQAFLITHDFPWPANALLVEMENAELVLVGTPYTPEATAQLLDWIKDHFGERQITAINTGYHVDNLGGNSALIERGIKVYGADLTAQLLKERGEQTRQVILGMLKETANAAYYQAHEKIPYVAPTDIYPIAEGLRLQFGGEKVEVYFPGASHAPDNVVVYFPAQKILFGGCMILAGDKVGNTSDADLKAWPEAIQKLKQFDVEIVVPNHGDRLDPGLIEHTLDLLKTGS